MRTPKEFKLKNGTTVNVLYQPESPSVTVAVLVRAGTAYENKKNNGISHFLEHMCFKGTTKRPTPMEIASEFESMGAVNNAFTSRDLTGYWAKVAYPNAPQVINLIANMYTDPLFVEKEIEKERGVIIEEINMYEDNPRAKVSQMLESIMYGDTHAGWDVAGPKENIKKISRKDFIDYRSNHYIGPKTFIVIAGNIEFKEAKKIVEESFDSVKRGKVILSPLINTNQKKLATIHKFKELDQTHFALGFKTFAVNSSKKFTLEILSTILGGGMSSRLFQRVREDLGAAYYVGSSPNLYKTHGFLDIFAGVNHSKAPVALEAIVEEIKLLIKKGVSDKELKRAKKNRIGNFLLSLETSSDLAFYYGEQKTVLGTLTPPHEVVKKLSQVTKEDVGRLAREVFLKEGPSFSIVGPYQSIDQFKKHLSL